MFVMNILLITSADPSDYGRFILVLSLQLLSFGAQNALILMPMNVLLPGRGIWRRRATMRMLSTLDLMVMGTAATIVGLLAIALNLPWQLCIGALALTLSAACREIQRTYFLTEQKLSRLLKLDALAMGLTVLSAAVLWQVWKPEYAVIFGLVLGNLIAVYVFGDSLFRDVRHLGRHINSYRRYWKKSRWALVGAGLTEAQMRLYVFMVELAKGSATLGIVHAGRVLVNPVALVAFAWARASRPIIARQLTEGDEVGALKSVFTGLGLMLLLGLLYILLLLGMWPVIGNWLEPNQQAQVASVLWLWCIFALLHLPPICFSVYLQAAHRYGDLSRIIAISTTVSITALAGLFFGMGIEWAVISLILGETMMIILLSVEFFKIYKPGRGSEGATHQHKAL